MNCYALICLLLYFVSDKRWIKRVMKVNLYSDQYVVENISLIYRRRI